MKSTTTILLLLLAFIGRGAQLDWSTPNTNNAVVSWYQYTNGPVLRYSIFYTLSKNVDTGTNWVTTTNWQRLTDVNSSTTNSVIPTNVVFGSRITYIVTVPGGSRTTPVMPQLWTNVNGLTLTNIPPAP